MTLTGQVVADPASDEKVTQLGKVTAVHAKVGDIVAVGAPPRGHPRDAPGAASHHEQGDG
ncbi:hypothetical protein NKG05_04170 [Oerskovia sp. M15]